MDLYDLYQDSTIRNASAQASAAAASVDIARQQDRRRTDSIEDRFDRLLLITEAMWKLLTEHYGLTDAHLVHMIHELDGGDGAIDGRRKRDRIECGSCGAAVTREHARCLYCGNDAEMTNPFERF